MKKQPTPRQTFDQVQLNPDDNTASFAVSDGIQDIILHKVAEKMWEKDLIQTFQKPYATKWSTQYGTKLIQQKADQRADETLVTPKGAQDRPIYPSQIVNITSTYPHYLYEENEAPPAQLDNMAIQRIEQNGQFLQKYSVMTEAEKIATLEKNSSVADQSGPSLMKMKTLRGVQLGLKNLLLKQQQSSSQKSNDSPDQKKKIALKKPVGKKSSVSMKDSKSLNVDIKHQKEDPFTPISLKDYEEMQENGSSIELGPERQLKKKLDNEIEELRKRKMVEWEIKKRRDTLKAQKQNRSELDEYQDGDLDEATKAKALLMAQQHFAPKTSKVRLLNAYPSLLDAQISSQTLVMSRQKNRRGVQMNIASRNHDSQSRERLGSGKSQLTTMTGITKAITEFTTKSYNNSAMQTMVSFDKNTKLTDYLKNDTTLGRDQQIGVGQASSFSGADITRKLQGGVSLTQFAPTREQVSNKKHQHDNETPKSSLNGQMTFDQKMEARAVEVRQAVLQASGGQYRKQGVMSMKEYKKIGGGHYTYADKLNSVKKQTNFDTTFREESNQSQSTKKSTLQKLDVEVRSKSTEIVKRRERAPDSAIFQYGNNGSVTDSKNRLTQSTSSFNKITHNMAPLQTVSKLVTGTQMSQTQSNLLTQQPNRMIPLRNQGKTSMNKTTVKKFYTGREHFSNSIFDQFNKDIINHANPKPLIENPKPISSELTLQAKANLLSVQSIDVEDEKTNISALKQIKYMNSQIRTIVNAKKKLTIKECIQKASGQQIEKAY